MYSWCGNFFTIVLDFARNESIAGTCSLQPSEEWSQYAPTNEYPLAVGAPNELNGPILSSDV